MNSFHDEDERVIFDNSQCSLLYHAMTKSDHHHQQQQQQLQQQQQFHWNETDDDDDDDDDNNNNNNNNNNNDDNNDYHNKIRLSVEEAKFYICNTFLFTYNDLSNLFPNNNIYQYKNWPNCYNELNCNSAFFRLFIDYEEDNDCWSGCGHG
jgi:hypothetical protein